MKFTYATNKKTGRTVRAHMEATCGSDELLLSQIKKQVDIATEDRTAVKIIVIGLGSTLEWTWDPSEDDDDDH